MSIRRLPPSLGVAVSLTALLLSGCGSDSNGRPEDYPLVEPGQARFQPPIRTANGAIITLPALPTVYETEPSPTCERGTVTYHDGSRPARRPVIIPPAPGVRAIAVTTHITRIEWFFRRLPDDCRPVRVLLTVRNGTDPHAMPASTEVEVHGETGTAEIAYRDFFPPPNVAHATAYSKDGHSSRSASVLIRRPANVPPDPPKLPQP